MVPLSLVGVPPEVSIMLPVEWAQYFDGISFGAPDGNALREEVLRVEVHDAVGGLVPGSTFFRQMPFTSSPAVYRPWWRPTQPLAPGAHYTVRVLVAEPSRDYPNTDCPWTSLAVTLELDVASEPVALAALVTSLVVEEGRWPIGYGSCESVPSERHCRHSPWTCCPEEPRGRNFRISHTVDPLVGGNIYYLASYELMSPYLTTSPMTTATFTLGPGFIYGSSGGHGPHVPDGECARVTVQSLLDDTTAVSPWTCARPEDFIDKVDDGYCDPELCGSFGMGPSPGRPVDDVGDSIDPGCAQGFPGATLWFVVLMFRRQRSRLANDNRVT